MSQLLNVTNQITTLLQHSGGFHEEILPEGADDKASKGFYTTLEAFLVIRFPLDRESR